MDTSSKRAKPSPHISSEKPKIIVQNDQRPDKTDKPWKKGKEKAKEPVAESKGEDDNSDVENAHATGKFVQNTAGDLEDGDESDSDDDQVPTALIHETLQKKVKKTSRPPKRKYVPEDETPNLRDQRTIFVGNLPIELVSKKVSCP